MGPARTSRLSGSRILKPLDDSPTWSIVCLFIRKDHRRRGLSTALINAAARFARNRARNGLKRTRLISRRGCRRIRLYRYLGRIFEGRLSGSRGAPYPSDRPD